MRFHHRLRLLLCLLGAIDFAICGRLGGAANAYTLSTLHTFCSLENCADGYNPIPDLLLDKSGNLYGTTYNGGTIGNGVVFELVRDNGNNTWSFHVIHTFCSKHNCTDGGSPQSGLIIDKDGNLYGTTIGGWNGGVAFELSPPAAGKKWNYKLLHSFCPNGNIYCRQGDGSPAQLTYAGAAAGLPYDGVSALYGVSGGGAYNEGLIFKLAPKPGTSKWVEKVLYNFCPLSSCPDGSSPHQMLIMDAKGSLYGTTVQGGANNSGVAFVLTPNSRGTKWTETTLYSFCALPNCADGGVPWGSPVMDATGSLYGTASTGGATGNGVVYKIQPNSANSRESVMYDFCSQPNCTDGADPRSTLVLNASGTLYGVTLGGGLWGEGNVFELNGSLQTLYDFCSLPNCTDGQNPYAGVIMDGSGNLFGTTIGGGWNNQIGSVFELSP